MLVFTIDDYITAIAHDDAQQIIEEAIGPTVKERATHIVPVNTIKRLVFKAIRFLTGDGKRFVCLENWTRRWKGQQLVDLTPSNGPIVGPFPDRASAIAWEVNWLAENL